MKLSSRFLLLACLCLWAATAMAQSDDDDSQGGEVEDYADGGEETGEAEENGETDETDTSTDAETGTDVTDEVDSTTNAAPNLVHGWIQPTEPRTHDNQTQRLVVIF
ncbi:hypothetical protein ACLKA6_015426 [Drosophila palustris]